MSQEARTKKHDVTKANEVRFAQSRARKAKAKELAADGMTPKEIAAEMGMTTHHIRRYLLDQI